MERKEGNSPMGIQIAMCRTQQQLMRELQTDNGSEALSQKINGETICQHGYIFMLDKFPEDILNHIYSFLPMQDAARVACVSHGFLRCWRRYPSLVFDSQTLGWNMFGPLALQGQSFNVDEVGSSIVSRIDHILKNHSGFGVKVLKLQLFPSCSINACHIDRWLEIAVKPGIEELVLEGLKTEYNFPCSLLSNEIGATIQSLHLARCAFHPTLTLGGNKMLTSLHLYSVHITGEELGQFLSNCPALVRLVIFDCDDVICFKVPCPLQQLDYLNVTACKMLQVIDLNAPKLSTFVYASKARIPISLGDQLEIKTVHMISYEQYNNVCYTRTVIPSVMRNVERLTVSSPMETVTTPMMPSKFLHLKYLDISLSETRNFHGFDFFSLVSFLDAAPALETFILSVQLRGLRHDSILEHFDGDWSHLRQMPECSHVNLNNVTITGFNSAKSIIELTSHIIQNASSLKCITLDPTHGYYGINLKAHKCSYMHKESLMEAQKALEAVRRYIVGKVPSSVNLQVLEPCRKCHTYED